MMSFFLLLFFGALLLSCSAWILFKRKMYLWLPSFLMQVFKSIVLRTTTHEPVHIIIAICDHFDFGSAGKYQQGEEKKIERWMSEYPHFADKHFDSYGHKLKHTWFFPPHYHRSDYLKRIVSLCSAGYGEVEMHMHHDHIPPFPDTSETLRQKIKNCIADFSKYGVFTLPDGHKTFAFIHGDWALDNSRNGKYCGVNDEIKILAEEGCYADFTFPSLHEAQPTKINSIYYVKDNPLKPKSYNTGRDVEAGGSPWGDLMLVQGPLYLASKRKWGIPFFPSIDAAEIQHPINLTVDRVKIWLKANVHVKGRSEWVFIKLHTHGAMDKNFEYNFGKLADNFFTELESEYKSNQYKIHYVTAREMYNIIKAAEAGKKGNPDEFRDFIIPRYVYLPL